MEPHRNPTPLDPYNPRYKWGMLALYLLVQALVIATTGFSPDPENRAIARALLVVFGMLTVNHFAMCFLSEERQRQASTPLNIMACVALVYVIWVASTLP